MRDSGQSHPTRVFVSCLNGDLATPLCRLRGRPLCKPRRRSLDTLPGPPLLPLPLRPRGLVLCGFDEVFVYVTIHHGCLLLRIGRPGDTPITLASPDGPENRALPCRATAPKRWPGGLRSGRPSQHLAIYPVTMPK